MQKNKVLLKKTCDVLICDPSDDKINAMLDYCQEFKVGFLSYNIMDVSDASGRYDTIATFVFTNEQDAMFFKLKFS